MGKQKIFDVLGDYLHDTEKRMEIEFARRESFYCDVWYSSTKLSNILVSVINHIEKRFAKEIKSLNEIRKIEKFELKQELDDLKLRICVLEDAMKERKYTFPEFIGMRDIENINIQPPKNLKIKSK